MSDIKTPNKIKLKNEKTITIILLSFLLLFGMIIDLFSPSLPAISSALGLSSGVTKLVISLYLLGYALGNFVVGLLTDALGRKSLLRLSCLIFVIFSLLPALIPNEYVLLLSRFGQGFFMGSMAVLNRSIFSDILPTEKLIKLGPTMGLLWGFGPIIGPVLGGYFQNYYGWKAGFYFFSIIVFILLIFIYIYIPETIEKKSKLSMKKMRKDIKEVLSNREFMVLVITMGIAYSLIITFNTLGPFLIQDVMGYSPLFFGKLAIFLGISFLPAPILTRYLLNYVSISRFLCVAIHGFLSLSLVVFLFVLHFDMSLKLLIISTAIIYFTCGSIFPISLGKGLSMFRHVSGTAAAVMYLVNMSITGLVSIIEGLVHANSVVEIVAIYICLVILIAFAYWYKLKDL